MIALTPATNSPSSALTLSPRLAAPIEPSAEVLTRGQKAARQFEAQLIGSVLESLEKTFAAVPGDDAVPGSDDYNYLGTEALAGALAACGGFGIGTIIEHYLAAHEGK